MSLEDGLQKEFPEATSAECKRFVAACRNDKKDADEIKELAEKLLEDYLDWRSCYGLDYRVGVASKPSAVEGSTAEDTAATATDEATPPGGENDDTKEENTKDDEDKDAADWKFAVKKALEVVESMKRAQEMEKKLKATAELAEELAKNRNPYADLEAALEADNSDSQKTETKESGGDEEGNNSKEGGDAKEGTDEKAKVDEVNRGEEKVEKEEKPLDTLPQVVYHHKLDSGEAVTDKNGNIFIHILPARIDRSLATADTYGLALALYLDRKFNRATEETVTVLVDVRPGEGWPNPMSVTMINFVRKVSNMLLSYYPGRLERLIMAPIPGSTWYVWNAIKYMFPNRMESAVFVPGPASVTSPLPKDKLDEFLEENVVEKMEQVRKDHFKPIGTFSLW